MTTLTYGTTTYTVEETTYGHVKKESGYILTGPRGATYGLMRNANRPDMLFVFNLKARRYNTPFEWVREIAPGVLEVFA